MATFDEVKKQIDLLEEKTNKKIHKILSACDEEVGIKSYNYLIQREHRNHEDKAWPIRLELIRWKEHYPNGVGPGMKKINVVLGDPPK